MRALVIGGGGTRGAFSAGVLEELHTLGFGAEFFDYIVGSSAGGCQAAYFSTGQTGEIVRAFTEHVPENFIYAQYGISRVDLVWLERLFREIEPLSVSALRAAKPRVYATVSNITRERSECVCLNDADDPVCVIVAGAAMAFFSPPVFWNDGVYCDGALGEPIPFRRAVEAGADEIWVIVNVPRGFRRKALRLRLISPFASRHKYVRRLIRRRAGEENKAMSWLEQARCTVIYPTHAVVISNRSRDTDALRATIAMGRAAAREVLCDKKLVR